MTDHDVFAVRWQGAAESTIRSIAIPGMSPGT
jgi:hypothetical protein